MTKAPPAKLFYLTNPVRGETIVNIQVEGDELLRFTINKDQLFALNAKSADILLRDFR
jgi:hypothetical protein